MASRRISDTEQNARSARPPATPVEVKPAGKPATTPVKKSARRPAAKSTAAADSPQAVIGTKSVPVVSVDERRALIARAAYLRGESRGFPAGGEAEDWLAAEKEVDALLSGGYRADQ
ncbi:MAG TPA: DUF2934 domain-containing protein [Steroidobacteraceae bacterium]|nr:DUF2934 domain-containing protein [Steroidobacteraceae bacterium]